jgi:hypothetical protein
MHNAWILAATICLAAAPRLAHAEDASARGLHVRNTQPTTSVGVRAGGSIVDGGEALSWLGELQLDAEVALGAHVALFGGLPFSLGRTSGSDHDVDEPEGVGNLTLGGLYSRFDAHAGMGGAVGVAVSFAGEADGAAGLHAHADLPSYWTFGNVYQAFATGRFDNGRQFLLVQSSYLFLDGVDDGESHFDILQLQLGGGFRLANGTTLLVEASAARDLEGAPADTAVTVDVGLRGGFDARTSWMFELGGTYLEGATSVGLSFELRTDLI